MNTRLLSYAVLVGLVSTSGCSIIGKNPIYGENGVFKDRNQEYEKAAVSKELEIPAHIQAKHTQDQFVIPAVGQTASVRTAGFEVPRPEFFYADTGSDAVNFKKVGDKKIIVVDEPIAAVWEKTLDFMKFNGVQIASADARQGVIESDWILINGPELSFMDRWIKHLTLQDIPGGSRNKLQVSLRPDPQDYERTSIEMKHVQFPEKQQVTDINWETSSQDVGYKSDMMFEMLRYMSKATVKPEERSLLALQQKHASRPLLGRDSRGNPVLKIDAPIDQSWNMLSAAVDSADMDVGTRNQNIGMLYMTYTTSTPVESQKDMGFFEWIFSDREEIKLDTSVISSALGVETTDVAYSAKEARDVPVLEEGEVQALADPNNPANQKGYKIWIGGRVVYVFGGDETKGAFNADTNAYEHVGKYQLKMNRTRSGVYVTVRNDQGLAAPAIIAEEILWLVKDNMPAG
ncbi:MAG: outer membrane protein assembly factor BamC [Pseudomonadales bacterium]|jgi:uncharacterized lipoprotein